MKMLVPLALAALVLVTTSCGPHRRGGGPCGKGAPHWSMQACGPEACTYDDDCFSNGAMRSNAGVCQECSGGKWVTATGCTAGDSGKCPKCGQERCCAKGHRAKAPCPAAARGK
jgi:hypothetical protein